MYRVLGVRRQGSPCILVQLPQVIEPKMEKRCHVFLHAITSANILVFLIRCDLWVCSDAMLSLLGKHISSQYHRVLKLSVLFALVCLSSPFLSPLFSRPCTYDGRTRYASPSLFSLMSVLCVHVCSVELHVFLLLLKRKVHIALL